MWATDGMNRFEARLITPAREPFATAAWLAVDTLKPQLTMSNIDTD